MLENIKVDIIYHLTASDFEMEFNLGGCCRMRLLTDKTQDKKSLVNSLAKAVSRSRVIIACGPLFSDAGLIAVSAAALGKALAPVNKTAYGINAEGEINIIDGSVPLVTPDGYFGGCIIESGPQTLILVTENRTFRKTIMKTLIHPYIEELSLLSIKQGNIAFKANITSVPGAAEFITSEVSVDENVPEEPLSDLQADVLDMITGDEDSDDSPCDADISPLLDPPKGVHNIEFVMDDADDDTETEELPPQTTTAYSGMLTKVDDEPTEPYEDDYIPPKENLIYISNEDLDVDRQRENRKFNALIIVLCLLLFAAVATLCYFVFLKPYLMGISTTEYLNQIFGDVTKTTLSFWR